MLKQLVHTRSGRENVAEICTPSPETNLRLADLCLGNSEIQVRRTPRGRATSRFLEGFLEGSLKEVLLRRVLRRRLVTLVRVFSKDKVLSRVLRRQRFTEGA